ncbi:MAG: type II toxin-antitoxin system HicB family antitoxin [Christensenellales bacterium]|jgi:predicted RNase H-like HicB family nuclease
MNKATYFAVFEPSVAGYGVYFPDLPGCISLGADFEEAFANAQEALGLHLWGLMDDGDAIPAPTFPPYAGQPDNALLAAVTVYPDIVRREMDNRAIRTNVSIPAWLKKAAEGAGLNYSQVLQEALKERLMQS